MAADEDAGVPSGEMIALRQALADLPPAERALVVMRGVLGLSYAEIGNATGSSPGSVGVKLHRARAKLRRQLGEPASGDVGND